ncbi:retrotransposon gag domain-containing protein [Artemisia annua]|uniref:Retrotransposon gag domain-containing protein n=1 Tax=Artemisia annua TaxID=35608 RepID=A0A2U1LNB2_ARTAN|nr:retrotransposon gag domain-containing protein [Artemisia annua]
MTEETPFTIPEGALGDGPNGPDPNEPPAGINVSNPTPENDTLDHTPENTSENAGDPVMQFVVQNFEQINAMYSAFSSKRKEINPASIIENDGHPVSEPWQSDSGGPPEEATQIPGDTTLPNKPAKKNRVMTENLDGPSKHKTGSNAAFYNESFTFVETERSVRDLVASPFTARIRDYDMPDGLKVPTNLRTYDGTTDPDDHLTIFMGTMDVHKLPEPAWCRFFHITLCGAARFWYDNLSSGSINSFHELRDKFRTNFLQQRRFQKTQAEILGIRQRSDESLREYLGRFGKETLHMTDRSDGMMTGAFISGLRPGRFFKDLIARPPKSMEDLFIQAHNFIRADEANIENRLRDSRWAENRHGQSYRDTSRRQRDRHVTRPNGRPGERSSTHKPTFTPLLKTPAEIYATSEGKSLLRPPPRMFAPAHRRDRTRYCEFHNDHGHDTNDCVDLRKEIETCIRNGRLSHLARGAKTHNNSQGATPFNTAERGKDQIDWKQKIVEPKAVNEVSPLSAEMCFVKLNVSKSLGKGCANSRQKPSQSHKKTLVKMKM